MIISNTIHLPSDFSFLYSLIVLHCIHAQHFQCPSFIGEHLGYFIEEHLGYFIEKHLAYFIEENLCYFIDEHLGYFVSIVNRAAVDTDEQVSL